MQLLVSQKRKPLVLGADATILQVITVKVLLELQLVNKYQGQKTNKAAC